MHYNPNPSCLCFNLGSRLISRKIFPYILGETAEKEFFKLRDRYARTKRNLRSKDKYGTAAKALYTAKLKMEEFKYFQWLEEFIMPRQVKVMSLAQMMMLMKVMKATANLLTLMRKRCSNKFLM